MAAIDTIDTIGAAISSHSCSGGLHYRALRRHVDGATLPRAAGKQATAVNQVFRGNANTAAVLPAGIEGACLHNGAVGAQGDLAGCDGCGGRLALRLDGAGLHDDGALSVATRGCQRDPPAAIGAEGAALVDTLGGFKPNRAAVVGEPGSYEATAVIDHAAL